MKFRDIFRQANAYAMQYGLLFGVLWIAGFFAFVYSLRYPFLQPVYLFCILAAPFMGWQLTRMYRKQATDDSLSFGIAYLFSLLLYLYASILISGAAYLYFGFLDHGQFADSYLAYLQQPEVKALMETPEMKQQLQLLVGEGGLDAVIGTLRNLPLAVVVSNILDINILLGLILSIPTALFNTRRATKTH